MSSTHVSGPSLGALLMLRGPQGVVARPELSCLRRGRGCCRHRAAPCTRVGSWPRSQRRPHPTLRCCVQVPGGHLGPGEPWQSLHCACGGAAAAAGEARGPDVWGWAPGLEPLPGTAQPCVWLDTGHVSPPPVGAAWWGSRFIPLCAAMAGDAHCAVSTGWTVRLRLRGQRLWDSPHHPEWLQLLRPAPGHVRAGRGTHGAHPPPLSTVKPVVPAIKSSQPSLSRGYCVIMQVGVGVQAWKDMWAGVESGKQ